VSTGLPPCAGLSRNFDSRLVIRLPFSDAPNFSIFYDGGAAICTGTVTDSARTLVFNITKSRADYFYTTNNVRYNLV
jgi:hypothetical protein